MGGDGTRFTRRSQGAAVSTSALEAGLSSNLRAELEQARWYQGKGRELARLELVDRIEVPASAGGMLAIVCAGYADGTAAAYAMPGRVDTDGGVKSVGAGDPLWQALTRLATSETSIDAEQGRLTSMPGPAVLPGHAGSTSRLLEADQSNTSIVLDGQVVLKCYRRLHEGTHPEQELLRGLTRLGSTRAPALLGTLEYHGQNGRAAVATAYAFVAGEPVGWERAIAELSTALGSGARAVNRLADDAGELGRCAGELHRDLLAAFGGSVATGDDARAARDRATAGLAEALEVAVPAAPELGELEGAARAALDALALLEGTALQRVHGDLHVGQLVRAPPGVVALDFEGNPTLSTEARRSAASPLQDVASLVLSLDHVAAAATRRLGDATVADRARAWSAAARAALLSAYDAASPHGPVSRELLRALEVEQEWREAVYAMRVLPEWLYAPRLVLPGLLA